MMMMALPVETQEVWTVFHDNLNVSYQVCTLKQFGSDLTLFFKSAVVLLFIYSLRSERLSVKNNKS